MTEKIFNPTIDEDLYFEIKILTLKLKINNNVLIEEEMRLILERENKKDKS